MCVCMDICMYVRMNVCTYVRTYMKLSCVTVYKIYFNQLHIYSLKSGWNKYNTLLIYFAEHR
jgi:hypothetical protein